MNNFIILAVLIAATGAGVYLYKKKQEKEWQDKIKQDDQARYNANKNAIEWAIKNKDYEVLESMLNSATQDFPDLIAKIKEALKNKPN